MPSRREGLRCWAGGMGGGAPGGGAPGAPDMAKLQELIQTMKTEEAGKKPGSTLEPVEEEADDAELPELK